ncbi:putative Cyclin-A1-1 [Nannochloris sp. 'desiccata']|nr:hypothetical protein KSW81_006585 [Chlorella desiccata (nom. nud.)]KAH7622359.1 putative Cyclin-A1-1 [Chlorella desiccata (nom. nud.)]
MSANVKPAHVGAAMLPRELWVQVISHLDSKNLIRALCTYGADAEWRRVYELLELRESEQAVLPDVKAIRKRQTVINERHRGILTEWLYEVSHEWDLDSGIVYEAVKILDCYLTHAVVETLGSFQLVGLACLRVAMRDFRPTSSAIAPSESSLEASRFAHISANTYTSEQVEEMTRAVSTLVPSSLNEYPNAKMHLRSLWFRAASQNGLITPREMHVYSLASFLLQLSLLDLPCCACAPSHLAAAALSLSMTAFNKPAWPRALEAYGSYTFSELEPLRHKLAAIQADLTASQLRRCWNITYGAQDIEHTDAWKQAMAVFDCPSSTLVSILGQNNAKATVWASGEGVSPAPSAVITQFESENHNVEIIEVDDDISSASTGSAIDGDILLASAPMSPVGESASLEIEEEVTARLKEERDDEGYAVAVPKSVIKASVPRGLIAAL